MKPEILTERLRLFPDTTRIIYKEGVSQLEIAGICVQDLAKKYGTPLYIYDRRTMDEAVRTYREALIRSYPGISGVTYAGKAFLCTAAVEWAAEQALWLDCTGATELELAVKAGLSAGSLVLHGASKTQADIQAAVRLAGTIVIDNLCELDRYIGAKNSLGMEGPNIWLRLRPGHDITSHDYTKTGAAASKFGLSKTEFKIAVERLLSEGLTPKGLHFHLGSQFFDPSPLRLALETSLDLVHELAGKFGWQPEAFCPGGGWGVAYHEADLHPAPISDYVAAISQCLSDGCRKRGLRQPRLQLEPGRSLTARAGVAIYQVQGVKQAENRRWVLIDGGMADNPRPALYQARYSAIPTTALERPYSDPVWIGGPYCESADTLIHSLPFPDVQPGETIAVPVSGAYQLSMSSNYNGALKPAVVWLSDSSEHLIRRRETTADLLRRDFHLHQEEFV